MRYLIVYLIVTNILAFAFYAADKKKAEKSKWRIKESALLAFALVGGGIGSLIGMKVLRHKTQKLKFTIGVPLLTIGSIGIFYLLYTNNVI